MASTKPTPPPGTKKPPPAGPVKGIPWPHPQPSNPKTSIGGGVCGSRSPTGDSCAPSWPRAKGGRETGRVFGTSGARPAIQLRWAEASRSGAKGFLQPVWRVRGEPRGYVPTRVRV